MKLLALTLLLLPLCPLLAQDQIPPPLTRRPLPRPAGFPPPGQPAQSSPSDSQPLTRFDIDFPGGTPAALAAAIQKASGKHLNIVIPPESADAQLPPLKMSNIDVLSLFRALEIISSRQISAPDVDSNGLLSTSNSYRNIGYSFTASFSLREDPVTDDTVWAFRADRLPTSPTEVRYYSLDTYLSRGFSVDDIITAIRSGWEMQPSTKDDDDHPKLSFHKETKLLIVVGDQYRQAIVMQVLNRLPASNATPNEVQSLRDAVKELQRRLDIMGNSLHIHFAEPALPSTPAPDKAGK